MQHVSYRISLTMLVLVALLSTKSCHLANGEMMRLNDISCGRDWPFDPQPVWGLETTPSNKFRFPSPAIGGITPRSAGRWGTPSFPGIFVNINPWHLFWKMEGFLAHFQIFQCISIQWKMETSRQHWNPASIPVTIVTCVIPVESTWQTSSETIRNTSESPSSELPALKRRC